METQTVKSSYRNIILLMLAGESIFVLPFLLARIYRPTFLDVFQLTNFELGTLYSTYGIVAVIFTFSVGHWQIVMSHEN